MQLEKIVSCFQDRKVLVIGDVMLDEYVWGEVNRISPEAPVPVVKVRERSHACGGAANVAANVVSLGAQGFLGGVVGKDPQSEQLRAVLNEIGVEADGLMADDNRPTTTKVRIIAHSQQVARVDSEQAAELRSELEGKLLDWVEERLPAVDACAVSDYNKGVVSPALAQRIIQCAREKNKPVVIDPKGVDFAKYSGATAVTPNVKEAESVLGREIRDERDIPAAGRSLVEVLEGGAVILTRGSQGMTVFPNTEELLHIPAIAKNVFDVTGAGDTVLAVLTLALASGTSLTDAAALANLAAGLVVGKLGTAALSTDELLRAS